MKILFTPYKFPGQADIERPVALSAFGNHMYPMSVFGKPRVLSVNSAGYTPITLLTKPHAAHRAALWASRGEPIEDHEEVDHQCGDTACCNPEHLVIATRTENLARRDMSWRPGRKPRITGKRAGKDGFKTQIERIMFEVLLSGRDRSACWDKPESVVSPRWYVSNRLAPEYPRPEGTDWAVNHSYIWAFTFDRGHPPQFTIDHLCSNPGCWNPSHLVDVPNVQNARRNQLH